MTDLTMMSTYDINQLIKDAQNEVIRRDKITKAQLKANGPKPIYVKPGARKLPSTKSKKMSDLEKQIADLETYIKTLES